MYSSTLIYLHIYIYTEGNKFSNIFYKAVYISDVLTTREIILFHVSNCTILGSKDAKVEGESLFTDLTCDQQSWNTFARETIKTI